MRLLRRRGRMELQGIAPAQVNLEIAVTDAESGEVLQEIRVHNLVTTAGRNLIRDLLGNDGVSGLTHFAVGTNSTAPALSDTALKAEVFRDQITQRIDSSNQLQIKQYLSSQQANGYTLREAGLFNAGSGGTLYARAVHVAIAKSASIAVTYTWSLSW